MAWNMLEQRLLSVRRQFPQIVPVGVDFLPATWKKYRGSLTKIVEAYPQLFPDYQGKEDYDAVSGTYTEGEHVDAWGCVWSNVAAGMEAIVTGHPVPQRADIHSLELPPTDTGLPHGFMYLRLLDLRGFEEAMLDFAEEPPELQLLIDKVLTYNLRQVQLRLADTPTSPFLYFGDDLGMQHGLAIGADRWRKYLKPCYEQIYAPCKEAGYLIYMHTDGHILPIISDLMDVGVDVLNPQVRANGLEELREHCQGRICIDLDLDRQLFPFATPTEIQEHIEEAVAVLGDPAGGLWLKAECGPDVPLANIEAICAGLTDVMTYYQ